MDTFNQSGGFLNRQLPIDDAKNVVYQAVDVQLTAQMDVKSFRLYLADLCGLTPTAYRSARQVYEQGISALIESVHEEKIPLWLAAKISTFSAMEQQQQLTKYFEFQEKRMHAYQP